MSTPPSVRIPDDGRSLGHDAYYAELVSRNRGLIPDGEQRQLRAARVLVAGCGSVGGAAVEPLVRLGVEHLILAEPGVYDLTNLNRQRAALGDVGRNKGEVLAARAREINPFAHVAVEAAGVTEANVAVLVCSVDMVIDGIDVTTPEPIRHKVALHVHAARARVPVVSGYDVAGCQAVIVYDYRRPKIPPLNGRVRPEEAATLSPMAFLARVVPTAAISLEIVPVLHREIARISEGFPQLAYTADLFGVLATRAVGELLAHRQIRASAIVDVHQVLRPWGGRRRAALTRLIALAGLAGAIRRARRTPSTTHSASKEAPR